MLRIFGVALGALMMTGTAQAATIGYVCDGKVQLIVAPNMEKASQCAAILTGQCVEGFRIEAGYFAIVQGANGIANGTSAGAHDAVSAKETAMSTCEAQNGGACSLIASGQDDGASFHNCE